MPKKLFRQSTKNRTIAGLLAACALTALLATGNACAQPLQGTALRPTPLLMPMDYTAARAQAWLNALELAATRLPPGATRRLADLGLAESGAARLALASSIFPVEVITPQISSSREIKVYLRDEGNFAALAKITADPELLAQIASLILGMRREVEELGAAWPASLDEARKNTAELEERAAALDALWRLRQLLESGSPDSPDSGRLDSQREDAAGNIPHLRGLAKAAPKSPVPHYLLARALLKAGKPARSVEAANRALDLARGLEGEEGALWSLLRPQLRYARALAQWRLNQLALAEDDLNAALREAQDQPASVKIRLLEARGSLRLRRDNAAGMCADFAAACALGNCQSLARARRMGHCAP